MCDFSGKLIAWMDGELTDSEAARLEGHVKSCAECRSRLATYREVSGGFVAYCEVAATAQTAPRPQRGLLRWTFAAAGAAAAIALLLPLVARHGTKSTAPDRGNLDTSTSAGRASAPAVTAAITATAVAGVPSRVAPLAERAARNPAHVHRAIREARLPANAIELPVESIPADSARSLPSAPVIEIAIPSDAIFPVGAVPDGVSFVAEVTLAADGTAEGLRLQPRFVEFQRRTIRP
jgi:negative regulator of sigma E activity